MPYAFLPDTSVLLNRKILDLITYGDLTSYQPTEKIIPLENDTLQIVLSRVVLAEIENHANRSKSSGSISIQIIEDLYKIAKQNQITIQVVGKRPTLDQIRLNPGGELDAMIRRDALDAKAIIVTGDHIQATMALVEGIEVYYIHNEPNYDHEKAAKKIPKIQSFFDNSTMSIHLRAHCVPLAKRGKPGEWDLVAVSEKPLEPLEIDEIAAQIIAEAKEDEHSFVERDEEGVSVVQLHNYRIVICRPPFSNAIEITAVRPLVLLTLDDYNLSTKVFQRLDVAEGILVAGSPGAGKSTFISALTKFYLQKKKIVKTLEAVRDLVVPPEVSQYSPLEGKIEKTADILLLVRPDFTIFDEVRVDDDFKVFGDLRLAGVGMVGVVHASRAVDAIQRFIRRIELGMIPNVIDTVIFIDKGTVGEILCLNMTVKKPTGFKDEDLSRPVVEVRDFFTNELHYEIYNFGQDTVVNNVNQSSCYSNKSQKKDRKFKYEKKKKNFYDEDDSFEDNWTVENQRTKDTISHPDHDGSHIPVKVHTKTKGIHLSVGQEYGNAYLNFYANDSILFSATVSRDGSINLKKTNPLYVRLLKVLDQNFTIYASFD